MIAVMAAALGGMAGLAPSPASATQATALDGASRGAAQPIQYYGERRGDDGGWDQRRDWREHRRAREEARIAEAARREAYRIEQERAERRAWRHTQRERDGYYRGY